jgi:predicted phage terminase large subunit-like protein
MPIRPIQRNTDKITRAFDVVPYLQTGLVYFPQNADWLTDLENELQQFTPTFSHKHDDQVDMFMDGIQIGLIEQNKVVSYGW